VKSRASSELLPKRDEGTAAKRAGRFSVSGRSTAELEARAVGVSIGIVVVQAASDKAARNTGRDLIRP